MKKKFFLLTILSFLIFTSCSSDDSSIINREESETTALKSIPPPDTGMYLPEDRGFPTGNSCATTSSFVGDCNSGKFIIYKSAMNCQPLRISCDYSKTGTSYSLPNLSLIFRDSEYSVVSKNYYYNSSTSEIYLMVNYKQCYSVGTNNPAGGPTTTTQCVTYPQILIKINVCNKTVS